jgi:plastocyanin
MGVSAADGPQLRSRPIRARGLAVALALAVMLGTLSSASAAWHEPVGGASGISSIGFEPSMASIGGGAYVAWTELHGNNDQVFVAHFNAAGSGWEKVGGPVNADLAHSADSPSLGTYSLVATPTAGPT